MNLPPEPFATSTAAVDSAAEARVVAWVLGESSAFEAADLERLCSQQPQLQQFHQRVLALDLRLIRAISTEPDHAWKLSPARRQRLVNILGEPPAEALQTRGRRVGSPRLLAVAACLLLTAVVLQVTYPRWSGQSQALAGAGPEPVAGDRTANRSDSGQVRGNYEIAPMARSQQRQPGLWDTARQRQLAAKESVNPAAEILAATPSLPPKLATATSPATSASSAPLLTSALDNEQMNLASAATQLPPLTATPDPLAAPSGPRNHAILASSLPTLRPAPAAGAAHRWDSALPPITRPLSDRSFQLATAALARGERPDSSSIQLEQFYNAVDYDDPAPAAGEFLATTIQQAIHPTLPSSQLLRVAIATADGLHPAAENLQVQVTFHPQRVQKSLLLGYRDSNVTTGTALYQIELLAGGSGPLGQVRVRFRDTASGKDAERSWQIPATEPAPAFQLAAPAIQLAGLSLLAAEKLQGGPTATAIDFTQLASPLARVQQHYASSPRACQLLQLIRQLQLP